MKIAGILAEYNPLHSGHIYHLSKTKGEADGVVVLLSGHLMQRGEFARYDKWSRTKAALIAGADLVIELSSTFCCASAERFASAAVSIFDRMDCIDVMSFGSESGDIESILSVARAIDGIEQTKEFKDRIKLGDSYPKARQAVLGKEGELLSQPNNTLAVEYCKAILKTNSKITPKTVRRVGAPHDGQDEDVIVSASFLRENESKMERYIPKEILDCFKNPSRPSDAIFLSRLRQLAPNDFLKFPDVSDGLENRLYKAAQNACSLDEFYSLAKSKFFTHSRLRRIAVYALVSITNDMLPTSPNYARILGFNKVGREILNKANRDKIFLSPDFPEISKRFPNEARIDAIATDLFYLGTNHIGVCGQDYRRHPIVME